MKKGLLHTVIVTTFGLATTASCGVESGVVVEKYDLPAEKALFVNLLGEKRNALRNEDDGADRKLFFVDSTYMEPFGRISDGDTIKYRNLFRRTYLDINKQRRIRAINGIRERDFITHIKAMPEKER